MRYSIIASVLLAGAAALPAQDAVDFEKHVWPIFERSCIECHRAPYKDPQGLTRNPKGGLRLDGKGWIMLGSNNERVVKPGDPGDSLLYILTTLDSDDRDFMPRKRKALTLTEQSTLERWIKQGADFGAWVGTGGPQVGAEVAEREIVEVAVPIILKPVARLGEGLKPLKSSVIAKAAGKVGQITPAMNGSPLLRVAFHANEDLVTDKSMAGLMAVQDRVTHLILGRTKITDRALVSVARMKRLTRLDLRQTAVTDSGLRALTKLPELRSLNLYGTAITDRGLAHLATMPTLERITVWETKVTGEGVDKLRQALPKAKIVRVLVLPPPAKEGDGNNRRRRKKD